MQGDDPRDREAGKKGRDDPAAELEALAEDWIALWQSEIAGLAADREAAEGWSAMTATWSALGAAWLRAATAPPFGRPPPGAGPNPFGTPDAFGYPFSGGHPFSGGPPAWSPGWSPDWFNPAHDRPAAPPRPAPTAAAPDPGGEPRDGGDREREDAALVARLAELERRLARLEPAGGHVPGGDGTNVSGGAGGDAKDRRRPRRRKPAG